MDDEPEVTRAQMDETRASLSEKLETLEHQVIDSVQDTSNAVQETVANVKDAVHDTVAGVKDMFDLHLQVQRHPWLIVGGSIALGYLGGYLLLRRRGADRPYVNESQQSASPDGHRTARQNHNGVGKEHRFVEEASETRPKGKVVAQGPSEPGRPSGVGSRFGPEISKLEGLVIGTVLSAVRDMITQSVPDQMKAEVGSVMDSFTAKLGGEPVQGPVFKDGFFGKAEEHEDRNSSESGSPEEQIGGRVTHLREDR
jgi:ElaB/YqjD/DUF883 family membrane-anchored ribosome-binding protein